MELWFEYAFAVEGVDLVVTVEWFSSSAPAATPFLTETQRHALTDAAVTPTTIYQAVKDRASEIRRGLALYSDVMARFGGSQQARVQAP